MGIGDFFSKAYNWVVDKAKSLGSSAAGAAKAITEKVKQALSAVSGIKTSAAPKLTGKPVSGVVVVPPPEQPHILPQVYDTGKNVTTTLYTDLVKKPLETVEGGVKGLSGAISSPFTWIALALGAAVVLPVVLKR